MPACCQALRARPAAALRVTAAPDIRFVVVRSGRAARRLARQSQKATHRTPATEPHGPADPTPNPTQLLVNGPKPQAPTHKPPLQVIKPHPHYPRLRRRQDQPDHHHAREHPRSNYEQPPRRRRSILESGLSRRNTVLRCQPANMSPASRNPSGLPPPQPSNPTPPAKTHRPGLDNASSI